MKLILTKGRLKQVIDISNFTLFEVMDYAKEKQSQGYETKLIKGIQQ